MIPCRSDLSPESLEFAERYDIMKRGRKSLVGVLRAKNVCLISDLIAWYIREGLVVGTREY
jgi:hypothetical protein